jgi:hypothetical protein
MKRPLYQWVVCRILLSCGVQQPSNVFLIFWGERNELSIDR